MKNEEEIWRAYVLAYDIDVPEDAIQRELELVTIDMKHRMQYDRLTGGDVHLFPQRELATQQEEVRAAALFEAKEPLVLAEIIAQQHIQATAEELRAEAEAIAAREGSTIDLLRRFFGDDFALLSRDVKTRKARAWALQHVGQNKA